MDKLLAGYRIFREKYTTGSNSVMRSLSVNGQNPTTMFVSCCDSRVDPALILQCDPGDLFVVRNVANIVPPYEHDGKHHGTSAALEFGINFLKVRNLIILGHSQCGGIMSLLSKNKNIKTDFIDSWVSIMDSDDADSTTNPNEYAKISLKRSYENCLTFPWIREKLSNGELVIHLWFFDIKQGEMLRYSFEDGQYKSL